MPAWKGDAANSAPNAIREGTNRAEKFYISDRSQQVRRDTDHQRNFTVNLYDIDETVLNHINNLQLQVEEAGKKIVVPAFFGSPEQWTSAQRDGYIRDNQGKLLLPAVIFKRTNMEDAKDFVFFNRHLQGAGIKLYSSKNKYTQFSVLAGQNAPVNEVYQMVVPDQVVITYHVIIWTDSVEQMNGLVENFKFNTNDYWGTRTGFRFRVKTNSFTHTVELKSGDDRVVKTEFDMTTHGYLLPDISTTLDGHQATFTKMMTPKKVIMGLEVVRTDFDMETLNKNKEKWRNPIFPNLQKDVIIPEPPIVVVDTEPRSYTAPPGVNAPTEGNTQPPAIGWGAEDTQWELNQNLWND